MVEPALFGPIDAVLAPVIGYLVFLLVVTNLITRYLAHRRQISASSSDQSGLSRHPLHETSNVLLIIASFYYLTLHHHSGIVLSVLVLGVVITDIFELEARQVEARNNYDFEPPKGAILISILVFLYAAYIVFLPAGPIGDLV